jgi:hypothetical protein
LTSFADLPDKICKQIDLPCGRCIWYDLQMRYSTDFPQAARQDLADSLGSDDPERFAGDRLAELDQIEKLIAVERRKWEGVRQTAQLFPDAHSNHASATADPAPEQATVSTPITRSPPPALKGSRKNLQEYPVLLRRLFDEGDPNRIWRTQDLTRGLIERGWIHGTERDEANRVVRALQILTEGRFITKVKKGQYQRAPQEPRFYGGGLAVDVPQLQATADDATRR